MTSVVPPPVGAVTQARNNLAILELLKQPELTAEERERVGQWAGWGVMAKAFDPRAEAPWNEIGERLRWLLEEDEYRAAKAATPNSFYTTPLVVETVWRVVLELGFTGGKVLEPGCGHGCFMAAERLAGVRWTGVERDPTTARIAQLLHPEAEIVTGELQRTPLRMATFDAAVGNVPFADVAVYDPTAPGRMSLHNYFIWRALQAVRPGALVAVVTSHYTMDGGDNARGLLADEADLVGAIRLPSGAFRAYGTDAVADVLVLRRRPLGAEEDEAEPWRNRARERWTAEFDSNEYFHRHPEQVLGESERVQGGYHGHSLKVHPRGELEPALREAARRVVESGARRRLRWTPPAIPPGISEQPAVLEVDGRKEGSFHEDGEQVVQIVNGQPEVVKREGPELRLLIALRDAALALLAAEADPDAPEAHAERDRAVLLYEQYVKKHGAINRCTIIEGEPDADTGLPTYTRRRPSMGGFRRDPDYVTVLALEEYDDETGRVAKAPFLLGRVNRRPRRATQAENPAEAVALCLDEVGRLDLEVVARLLRLEDREAAGPALGDLAYQDPTTGVWVTADEYLSGDARVKLAEAQAAAEENPERWQRNVAALEPVQPTDLGPHEIKVRMGTPIVAAADVRDFLREHLGGHPKVTHDVHSATWAVEVDRWARGRPAATAEWGTSRVDAYRLVELGLNNGVPVVYDEIRELGGKKRNVRNMEETMLAEQKLRELQLRFADWAFEDPDRCDRIVAEYNRLFNSVVLRQFDGKHLTFPGLTTTFDPWSWQRDIVYRIASTGATLCGHAVGAGKTASMAMSAMSLQRMGFATKVMVAVPNHLLEQVSRDFKALYPSARILMASSEDVTAERRRLFAARCATGEWDAIVITHTAFTSLGVQPEVEAEWLREQIDRYEHAAWNVDGEDDGGYSRTVKRIAKQVETLRERLLELMDHPVDVGVSFEQLGVDFVMVDEAHYFKNLGVLTKSQGFSLSASQRAADLDMKLWWLRHRNESSGRYAALFTGTPISNTLAESYVLMRYLMPDRLAELGIESFDAWAAVFVEFEVKAEVAPDGGTFRMYRRPSKFGNVPELRLLLAEASDILPADEIDMPRPTADFETVVVQPSPELVEFVGTLVARADAIRNGSVKPHEDNMLKVCTDGRQAALDVELVGLEASAPGKVEAVVERVVDIWRTRQNTPFMDFTTGTFWSWGSVFQVVFCDMGTPHDGDARVYGKVRDGLIAAGMDPRRVRFIHEAKTPSAKTQLFSDCRGGQVDVLLGSTEKLGTGTNIQPRLVAIHHLDAPWRPADVEQREGRAIRPGNLNERVQVIRYVTERSFDSYMWQALERKIKFIRQVLSGKLTAREVEDIGDGVLSYSEVKALATGNTLLLELAEVDGELVRLRTAASGHIRGIRRVERDMAFFQDQVDRDRRRAEALERVAKVAAAHPPAYLPAGRSTPMTDHTEVGRVLAGYLRSVMRAAGDEAATERVGRYAGIPLLTTARRGYRDWVLNLRLESSHVSLDVPVNERWLAKAQEWRLTGELAGLVANAGETAASLRLQVRVWEERYEEAAAQSRRPFEHADALRRMEARKESIEERISKAAKPERPEAAA